MCGIYGSTILYSESQVKEKLERSAFRGPDKTDFKYLGTNKNIIFGHNRLSIIDLDERSNQPFTYNSNLHIVFNGEIYNFKSIKNDLEKKGYEFYTTSDTEVVCAAYLEYGQDFVKKLNGMFALVIYDESKSLLFGSRDRTGQKPFYYYLNHEKFEFSSQLSSIQLHHKNLTISSESISYYLAWGNIPDPLSIFNEIKKIKAGHSFIYDLKNNEFNEFPYWDIDYKGTQPFKGSYKEAKSELNNLIKDAVSSRLYADVPVGVFLSGGVDSSVVAALATKSTTSKIKTFSVKFNEEGFDESTYAQKVADHLHTDHHVIECNYEEGIDLIENFCHYYDEPFADSSAIPSMLLAKYTREKVTVALSGDGGDESFIGYHRYNWMKKGKLVYKLPYGIRYILSKLLSIFPHYRLKILADTLKHKDLNTVYLQTIITLNQSWIKSKYDYLKLDERKYLEHSHKNIFERISDFDIKTYLNWDINTKVDRATMAYSLEARAPLLDHRIIDFARSLPTHFKMDSKHQKRILKDVLYEHVPKSFFDRPKSGFGMPFADWFRGQLKPFVLSELSEENLNTIPNIDVKEVSRMIQQHMSGSWNRFDLIWKLLVLKQWLNNNGKGYLIE